MRLKLRRRYLLGHTLPLQSKKKGNNSSILNVLSVTDIRLRREPPWWEAAPNNTKNPSVLKSKWQL